MAMTLSTTPSSRAAPTQVNDRWAEWCALACAGSAGVHAVLVVPHARASTALAVAFALTTVALAGAAACQVLSPTPVATLAGSGLLLAVATAYVLSRTTGLPVITHHTESFDPLGTVVSLAEATVALVVVRQLLRRHT
jgi:CHASE2 domain-containing sensor protein